MRWVISFICGLSSLYGDLEDHLKRIEDKTPGHSMRNIDFIYIINLDARPEKFASCLNQLHPYGIDPFRFSAVNGWELSFEAMKDLGVKFSPEMNGDHMGTFYFPEDNWQPRHFMIDTYGQTYFSHCMSRGAIGIVLSHLSVLQDALDSGYETIWVMEDDIETIKNPNRISNLIDLLDSFHATKDWDILFTDKDTKDKQGNYVPCMGYAWRPNFIPENTERFYNRQNIGRFFQQIGARYGAYSMIIRRSGMEKILNFIKEHSVFLPYDMEFYLPNDIRMYAVREDVVSTQTNAPSDNGAPNYQTKE